MGNVSHDTFGNWKSQKRLPGGGQGDTFVVSNASAPTVEHVLKSLRFKRDPHARKRFEQEILALQKMGHENVLRIVDSNIANDPPYYVSEYCRGGTLSKLDLNQLDILDKMRIYRQICDGLAHVHSGGMPDKDETVKIVHRDLKPQNIFLREDKRTPVLGDFGICYIESEDRHTQINEQVGPRFFMAPEFEDGFHEDVQPSSDIYAMGKILYWMVSNGQVFSREKHKEEKYDLRKRLKETWIFHVYEILDASIRSNPSERYQSADTLRDAVDQCIELIQYQGRAVGARDQRCIFCAIGTYRIVANGAPSMVGNPEAQRRHWASVSTYLYPPKASATAILECDNCGNIQFFSLSNQSIIDKWKILK